MNIQETMNQVKFTDLLAVDTVEVTRDRSGKLWINVNGMCCLRIRSVAKLVVTDDKPKEQRIVATDQDYRNFSEAVESHIMQQRAAGTGFSTPAEGSLALVDDVGKLSELIRSAKGHGLDARTACIAIAASAAMYVFDVCDEGDDDESLVDEDDLKDGEPDRHATLHEDDDEK